ncbi:TIGR02450 family Trp-rich protein [Atopomonas sediminilitoris]|uniref:TIGR02450 family Trp-rich protein n=1 Tax=Atopomonas sediminilitoris TaxID=2919919 RepID=UPI001F4E6EA3|nr:TIGR02450 family Trp-rich protein [Atopomonas sediminilitoris]MCJ8168087.1 TIGR02450 family Trp-rich protein [Atopomonas sediminilitoris]
MARQLNPEKLLLSKWTAQPVINREKHFLVVQLLRDDQAANTPNPAQKPPVRQVVLEAVLSKRQLTKHWQDLLDEQAWRQGWQ